MKTVFTICVIFITAILRSTGQYSKDVTLPLRERIALLKFEIAQAIEQNNKHYKGPKYHNQPSDNLENVEYADLNNMPITPINENDERKKDGKFLLRKLKTTAGTTLWTRPMTTIKNKKTTKPMRREKIEKEEIVADDLSSDTEEVLPKLKGIEKILKRKKSKVALRHKKMHSGKNIFYRRVFHVDMLKHCSQKSMHCIELLTPVLSGHANASTVAHKGLSSPDDPQITRLLHLLSVDTKDLPKDDILPILYQISNLHIRLFQWDVYSLRRLLDIISRGSKQPGHTWRSIKNGLKRIFASWHLDVSNVTSVLYQTRIFRPPCIAYDYGGSTQSPKVHRLKKIVKPKCADVKDNSESCELGN